MEKAKMTVIFLDQNDIITDSEDFFSVSNLGDYDVGNNRLIYRGTTYSWNNIDEFYVAFNTNNGTDISGSTQLTGNNNSKSMNRVFGDPVRLKEKKSKFVDGDTGTPGNGTYVWNEDSSCFVLKQ